MGEGPAELCFVCNGSGVICPYCRGARWVRTRVAYDFNGRQVGEKGSSVIACPECTRYEGDKQVYDPEREAQAIDKYFSEMEVGDD